MLVTYQVHNRIAEIILDRPEKRNALSPQLIQELYDSFDKAEKDNAVKIVILRSSGKTFCAGADLAYIQAMQSNTYEENLEDSQNLMRLFLKIYELPKVSIAQVEGAAIAGGCGLAFVTDFTFASEEAIFGYSEVNIGFIPALVSVFLSRKVGESSTKYLLLSGLNITAQEAKQKNLVHEVYPTATIASDVLAFATMLVNQKSANSLASTKKLIHQAPEKPLYEALQNAAEQNAIARDSEDCKKGIQAFLNKQPIIW